MECFYNRPSDKMNGWKMKKPKNIELLVIHFQEEEDWRKLSFLLSLLFCLLCLCWASCNDNGCNVEWQWSFCWVVKTSCVVCLVNIYLLSNFALEGDKKWENGDWMVKFWRGAFRDFQQGFKGVVVKLSRHQEWGSWS